MAFCHCISSVNWLAIYWLVWDRGANDSLFQSFLQLTSSFSYFYLSLRTLQWTFLLTMTPVSHLFQSVAVLILESCSSKHKKLCSLSLSLFLFVVSGHTIKSIPKANCWFSSVFVSFQGKLNHVFHPWVWGKDSISVPHGLIHSI